MVLTMSNILTASTAAPSKVNGITINTSLLSTHNCNISASRAVKYIVIHYTGNKGPDTARANAQYFRATSTKASAHYCVDNTSVYQCIDLKNTAWHCGTSGNYYHKDCRNVNSIGIEMCCTAGNYKVSEITIENAAVLTAALCKIVGIETSEVGVYVLRHYDVTHKTCPAQMSGARNAAWTAFLAQVVSVLSGTDDTNTEDSTVATEVTLKAIPYMVRVTAKLNVRKGPGTKYSVVRTVKKGDSYTIVEEQNGWGKLKSGVGWIRLSYTEKV
jgi:N-acetylmuramoyl-L-alanine amidase CwlA